VLKKETIHKKRDKTEERRGDYGWILVMNKNVNDENTFDDSNVITQHGERRGGESHQSEQ